MPHRFQALLPLLGVSATISQGRRIRPRNLDWQKVINKLLSIVSDIETLISERTMDPEKSTTIPQLLGARDKILQSIFYIRSELQGLEPKSDKSPPSSKAGFVTRKSGLIA